MHFCDRSHPIWMWIGTGFAVLIKVWWDQSDEWVFVIDLIQFGCERYWFCSSHWTSMRSIRYMGFCDQSHRIWMQIGTGFAVLIKVRWDQTDKWVSVIDLIQYGCKLVLVLQFSSKFDEIDQINGFWWSISSNSDANQIDLSQFGCNTVSGNIVPEFSFAACNLVCGNECLLRGT